MSTNVERPQIELRSFAGNISLEFIPDGMSFIVDVWIDSKRYELNLSRDKLVELARDILRAAGEK